MKPSRRTITTPNRFTTCTPSWRVSLVLPSVCFFLLLLAACKDNAEFIGFRHPPKLGTYYIEIPLDKSAILYSPVSTRNTSTEALARIMVGKYQDPNFGNIEARGYFNFAPPLQDFTVPATATLTSLELKLKFDYYAYGGLDSSDQRIQVFELTETLNGLGDYYNNSTVSVSASPIGDITFAPGPVDLANGWKANTDADANNNQHFYVTISLTGALGDNLLSDLINKPGDILTNFDNFSINYPGLALVMIQGNKIFGISPIYELPYPVELDSKLSLHWQDGTNSGIVDFPIYYGTSDSGNPNAVMSFSTITTDFAGTPLDGIQPFTDFTPLQSNLFVQAGAGILTKFDLKKFYGFADTLDNVVINSAEMVLTNTTSPRVPQKLELKLLDSTNHFRSLYYDTLAGDVHGVTPDQYLVRIQKGLSVTGSASTTSSASVNFDLTGATVSVNQEDQTIGTLTMTEFFQQIFFHRNDPRRVRALGLIPAADEFNKTISSLVLDHSVALRIYYSRTKPPE